MRHTIWMHLEDILLCEISQSQETNTAWPHLCEVPRVVKFLETEEVLTARG